MNERLEIFLESSSTAWDNYRGPGKPVPISVFTDPIGGTWDVKNTLAPCGGPAEYRDNPYRQYWFCERHQEEGVLVQQYRNNVWCWLSGKVEVKKL